MLNLNFRASAQHTGDARQMFAEGERGCVVRLPELSLGSSAPSSLAGVPQRHKALLWPGLGWVGSLRPHPTHWPHGPERGDLRATLFILFLCFLRCCVPGVPRAPGAWTLGMYLFVGGPGPKPGSVMRGQTACLTQSSPTAPEARVGGRVPSSTRDAHGRGGVASGKTYPPSTVRTFWADSCPVPSSLSWKEGNRAPRSK